MSEFNLNREEYVCLRAAVFDYQKRKVNDLIKYKRKEDERKLLNEVAYYPYSFAFLIDSDMVEEDEHLGIAKFISFIIADILGYYEKQSSMPMGVVTYLSYLESSKIKLEKYIESLEEK